MINVVKNMHHVDTVEFVLGLCGSTMGNMVAFILPAAIFLQITSWSHGVHDQRHATERKDAKLVLTFGIVVLMGSTFSIIAQQNEVPATTNVLPDMVRDAIAISPMPIVDTKNKGSSL